VLAGGCGQTRVLTAAAPPPWATAGFTGAPLVPWALSDSGQSLAYLFAKQLVAGVREDGTSNKVLWVMKGMGTLRVTAHPAAGAVPSIEIGGQMTNVNQLPTPVDLPAAGCWSFDLSWGKTADHMSLQVLPQGPLLN